MDRPRHLAAVEKALRRVPVVALLGPRQIGKTTLALTLARRHGRPATRFDLEDPEDLRQLADAKLALSGLRGLVVLDEIQRRPELFPVLRVLADRRPAPARFLVLGSASPELLRQSSESLAGRIHYHELTPFGPDETGAGRAQRLWQRGGFPRAFLARSDAECAAWRRDFIRTYLERDVPQLGLRLAAETLYRFWSMLAHYHGQIWGSSEFARSFGMSDVTVRRYLDLLSSLFLVRQLAPWHENLGKRLVKSPKVYIRDTGLLHQLLGLETQAALLRHPKLGASWEGYALAAVETRLGARRGESFFYATHGGAELDLLVVRGRRRLGFEFKRTVAPELTKSMRIALADLRLERLDVIHAGEHSFPLAERVRAVPLARILQDIRPID
ncbi:MAG: ATP-binding protein [Betaproteobacteria bacterium]|nr:ATP-binding protein [Betaproteobacteria bacterium]MSQ87679.1 ATP-binding protein [Betaproteobacteria bacterium]